MEEERFATRLIDNFHNRIRPCRRVLTPPLYSIARPTQDPLSSPLSLDTLVRGTNMFFRFVHFRGERAEDAAVPALLRPSSRRASSRRRGVDGAV